MKYDGRASDIEIKSEEEFHKILQDMYCTEECFEGMHYWVGDVLSKAENSEILRKLADDSNEHKDGIEELISKIEGIEPEDKDMDKFDFEEDVDDENILKTVLETDYSALYHYSLLKTNLEKDLLSELLSEEDKKFYHETLDRIIEDELRHIRILRSNLDLSEGS